MADKENSAYAAAAAPRITRASAKRAAAVTAVAVAAKRKRVALSEIPTHPNAALQPHTKPKKSSQVAKPKKKSLSSLSLPAPKPAPDAVDETGDPQLCAPYASDIYSYLRSMEVQAKRRPAADYIERVQVDVTPNMRGILVDWLVEVAEEYKLVSDTLYLTVSYIDRFLSANSLNRQKLQLLGVSAMLIASKYEEISPPNVEDFCYITDNTYMKQELVKMERDILNNLKFEMGNPTAKTFLRMFIRSGQEDKKSKKLQSVTGYRASELKDCVTAIHDLQLSRKGQSWNAIRDKYKQHRFKGVSALLPPVGIPASYFEDLKE